MEKQEVEVGDHIVDFLNRAVQDSDNLKEISALKGVMSDISRNKTEYSEDGSTINEYSLSTPWDLSTASFVQSDSSFAYPKGLCYGPSGKHLYVGEGGNNTIIDFGLREKWTLTSTYTRTSLDVSGRTNNVKGVDMGNGYHLIWLDNNDQDIHQYEP